MKKTLYLIRHGETLFNEKNIIQGWCDAPLTQKGIAQARAARKKMENMNLRNAGLNAGSGSTSRAGVSYYCSPLGRAQQTMKEITDQDYTIDEGLKEMNFGRLEGENCSILPAGDHKRFMTVFEQFEGDTPEAVHQRMYEALSNIMEEDPSNTVIAVSHGIAIVEFLIHHAGLNPEDFSWQNCAIHKIEYEDGKFKFIDSISDHCID